MRAPWKPCAEDAGFERQLGAKEMQRESQVRRQELARGAAGTGLAGVERGRLERGGVWLGPGSPASAHVCVGERRSREQRRLGLGLCRSVVLCHPPSNAPCQVDVLVLSCFMPSIAHERRGALPPQYTAQKQRGVSIKSDL